MKLPDKATQPTMYFIGVTTEKSSIMKLFPLWAKELGLDGTVLKGIDITIHAPEDDYRKALSFIKDDPLSLGALVTTHKIDMYNACKDLFDFLDPYSQAFGELSSISKKDGRLVGHAKDPISSGLALEAFVPKNFWHDHSGEVFIMGAGGSARAMAAYLFDQNKGLNVPSKMYVANRSTPRLESMKEIMKKLCPKAPIEYHHCPDVAINDTILKDMKPFSLIVNATGLGKDRPGSPLSNQCEFPQNSLVWEINYRGDLLFMHQALHQKEKKNLTVEDGWIYFIHGWTQVIAEVFHIDITEDLFRRIESMSNSFRF